MAGTCEFCNCSEAHGCEGGCSWTDDTQTRCSLCASAAETAAELVRILGLLLGQAQSGVTLAVTAWNQLTHAQQLLLVQTCREVVDTVRQGVYEALSAEAVAATLELSILAEFIGERFSDQVREDDLSVSQIAIRLLEPHVGSRIVLPGAGR